MESDINMLNMEIVDKVFFAIGIIAVSIGTTTYQSDIWVGCLDIILGAILITLNK